MSLIATINQLLADMDMIRPLVIAAKPDDAALRATTRRMITALEAIKSTPAVPISTYLWLSQITAQLLDAEHGALLKPEPDGLVPEAAQASIRAHATARQQLLAQALQDIPPTHALLDRSCKIIGNKAKSDASLPTRAQHLYTLLYQHIQQDSALRAEMKQLIEAFNPAIEALANALEQVGEDAPELKLAKRMLEQELPENAEEARALLQNARQSILQAGTKLSDASGKLHHVMQHQMEKMSDLSSKLQQAESDARNDPLTGLANRRQLAEFLQTLGQTTCCFLVVDIDFFKKINDSYGHDVGDEILQQLASLLRQGTRRGSDLVTRIGGEEFCIVLPATSTEQSTVLANKLRQSVEGHHFQTQQGNIDITISIGLAEHQPNRSHAQTFKAADQALYQSKHQGRNRVTAA